MDQPRAKLIYRPPIWLVLAAVFGGLAAFSIALVATAINWNAWAITTKILDTFAVREIDNLERSLKIELKPALEQVKFLSGHMANGRVRPDDDQRLSDLLMGSLASSPQLTAVSFIRNDLKVFNAARQLNGELYVTVMENGLRHAGYRQAFRLGSESSDPTWGEPIFVEELGIPVMSALAPVRREGEVIGVFAAVVSLPAISFDLKEAFENDTTPFVLIQDGRVYSHPNLFSDDFRLGPDRPLPRFDEINDAVLAQFDERKAENRRDTDSGDIIFSQQIVDAYGLQYLILSRKIPNLLREPVTVGIYLQSSVVATYYDAIIKTALGVIVAIIIAFSIAFFLGRRIGHPIHDLAEATQRLAALDFSGAPALQKSRFREIDVAANAYNSMRNGLGWFSTYVPQSLVPHLMSDTSSQVLASREVEVTVLFTDIIGFSGIAQRLSPRRLAAFLNRHFTLLGGHIVAEGGSIDKYIGDSIMAFWGAPEAQEDHALRAVRAAQRISARLTSDNERRAKKGLAPVRIRVGIHSGRAIAGNIGAPGRINYTLVGDAVNIAQRLEQFGKEVDDGRRSAIVSISADAAKLLPPDIALTSLGRGQLPGRNDETEIYQLN